MPSKEKGVFNLSEVKDKVVLTQEQEVVVDGIKKWFKNKPKQTCSLVGYAGTGKTFLVDYIIEELKLPFDKVAFATYTGKASLVLKENNKNFMTSTIHRLIYDVEIDKDEVFFDLKSKKDLQNLKLIVIDEASMVPENINEELLSFGIPVLYVGDQGQLPPISSGKNKTINILDNPDFKLTQIHRQAEGNPIIKLSMLAREGRKIEYGKYGDKVLVIPKASLSDESLINLCSRSDQVICGYNRTRKNLNDKIRKKLGFTSTLPEEGDKLICLKNSWDKEAGGYPLINGMTGFAERVSTKKRASDKRDIVRLDFFPDIPDSKKFEKLKTLKSDFKGEKEELNGWEYKNYQSFDFGYAITCHKSQGSQYENLTVFNEVLDRKLHHKWLYTAITRSTDKLVLVI